jgi:hypothetical protein
MNAGIRTVLIAGCWVYAIATTRGQVPDDSGGDPAEFLESFFPWPDEDFEYSDLYDQQLSQIQLPLDLNSATREELTSLWAFSDEQIDGLLTYRQVNGPLLTVYELLSIPGFDAAVVGRLDGMVTAGPGAPVKPVPEGQVLLQAGRILESQAGYNRDDSLKAGSVYAGDPWRALVRFRMQQKDRFSLGFTAEKDAGELLIWEPSTRRYGMDYYAGHAMLQGKGVLRAIVLGDFSVDQGQGLVFGNGFRNGMGLETVGPARRRAAGLRPYTSVFEGRQFRGLAVQLGAGRLSSTVFYSMARRDALVREEEDGESGGALQLTGYHRTATELDRKHRIMAQGIGFSSELKSRKERLTFGLNALYTHYDLPLVPLPRKYNHYAFRGAENYTAGFHGAWQWKSVQFYGEAARSQSGGMGALLGFIGRLSPSLSAVVLYRRYDPDFHSFQANAFRESTYCINETGLYWGMQFRLLPWALFSLSLDSYQYPWLKYRVDGPSEGSNYLAALQLNPGRSVRIMIQYRRKASERNFAGEDDPMFRLERGIRQMAACQAIIDPPGVFRMKTRLQGSHYRIAGQWSTGYLLAQELECQTRRAGLVASLAYFRTDDYDNRQYLYERDVWYSYGAPLFQGRGLRLALNARLRFGRHWGLACKLGRTLYQDRDVIGEGAERIEGAYKTSLVGQLRFDF